MTTKDTAYDSSQILSKLPPIFVSRTHFSDDELNKFEDSLDQAGATLTYDVLEAGVILSKVAKKTRLLFDLRAKGISIDESVKSTRDSALRHDKIPASAPDSSTNACQSVQEIIEIEDDDSATLQPDRSKPDHRSTLPSFSAAESARGSEFVKDGQQAKPASKDFVYVVRTEWLQQSLDAGQALPFDEFSILSGYRKAVATPVVSDSSILQQDRPLVASSPVPMPEEHSGHEQSIIERAKEDASTVRTHPARSLKRKFQGSTVQHSNGKDNPSWAAGHSPTKHAHLLHLTTSEEDHGFGSDIPEPPEWVLKGIKYACQRITLMENPNEEFIELLRIIKLARLLTSDEIGVRAYSTSIAALRAYPYRIINPREIMRLPGCDAKIANLFVEYANTGSIKAVEDIEADHDLTILRLFYNIWGVGGLTAREFYFDRGWQDLDDLVEYNWKGLSRVQQIGVKYYDEFLSPIPRAEVEEIGRIVHEHAVRVRDADVQSMIVGGYRRGKTASGDVDIIVSHPDEDKTLDIITDIVASLEDAGWITHTLLLSTNNTKRDQQTLPFRSGDMHGGHGFDSLDKALVVWQDPDWPTKDQDLRTDPAAKNNNIHRRVDIIIAPWRTVGCAVLGWSGGTTFQRDVRRYVKHLYGWKFDSSGVRDRGNGDVLDLEGFHRYEGMIGKGKAKSMLEAEKRVFEGLHLEYREAWERCTD